MDGVKLKLNQEKSEFIIIGQKATRESLAPNFPVPLLQTIYLRWWKERILVLFLTQTVPLTIMLPRFAEHVTTFFVICDTFSNSLVLRLQYF